MNQETASIEPECTCQSEWMKCQPSFRGLKWDLGTRVISSNSDKMTHLGGREGLLAPLFAFLYNLHIIWKAENLGQMRWDSSKKILLVCEITLGVQRGPQTPPPSYVSRTLIVHLKEDQRVNDSPRVTRAPTVRKLHACRIQGRSVGEGDNFRFVSSLPTT